MTCLVGVVQALYVVVQWWPALGGDIGLGIALEEKHVWNCCDTGYSSTHLLKLLPIRETARYAYPV